MKFLVVLACLLASAWASPLTDPSYIMHGQTARVGQFPWVAKIPGCTASILNARTILTAAHCVCMGFPNIVEVGTVFSGTGEGTNYSVVSTHVYPGYPIGMGCAIVRDYDFAVLKTSSDIVFNVNVTAIPLYTMASEPPIGSSILSMGYGGDHLGRFDVLNYANTTLTNVKCSAGFFCSSRLPNSIFSGDSGGPMVYRAADGTYYQLGVNSGISSTTSMYANVPRYQNFIKLYM